EGANGAVAWALDADGDGFPGDANLVYTCGDSPGETYVEVDEDTALDCDDTLAVVNPGATEICDSLDNDCDGVVDPDGREGPGVPWYYDLDGDGLGDDTTEIYQCYSPGDGWINDGGDCDDDNESVKECGSVCDGCNL